MGELAAHLGMSEEVIEGLVAASGYTAGSLDMPIDADQDSPSSSPNYADITGGLDAGMELVENLYALAPLPATLDDRAPRSLGFSADHGSVRWRW